MSQMRRRTEAFLTNILCCLAGLTLLSLFLRNKLSLFPETIWSYEVWQTLNATEPSDGLAKDQTCQFPLLNPWDDTVLEFIDHPAQLVCGWMQPQFVHVVGNKICVNRSQAERHGLISLQMRQFWRPIGSDMALQYGNWADVPISECTGLESDVELRGRYASNRSYANVFANVLPPKQGTAEHSAGLPNVLLFGIDSLSRSNFLRNLPRTYETLSQVLGGWDFRGYSKIDDNTFPNMLAVLSGHKVTVHGSELEGDFQDDFIDHYPFVWKNFSQRGYTTGLFEEQPGIFSYKAKGFRRVPTDIYLRPFGLVMNNNPLYDTSSKHCFGNGPEAATVLDSLRRFIEQSQNKPYFAFSFLWKLSHDRASKIEILDEYISSWFRDNHSAGTFKNTVVMVMADHGNRFDRIRSTLIGRYEERMPFLFIHLPQAISSDRSLTNAFDRNTWRLTCQFDVFETLVDVLSGDLGRQRDTLFNRGVSLFREIPKNRTCRDIGIPYHFCVCQVEKQLDAESGRARASAAAVVRHINGLLANQSALCRPVELRRVVHAQSYEANERVRQNSRWDFGRFLVRPRATGVVSFTRVTLLTAGDALFEALVRCADADDCRLAAGDVSRINAYGSDGDCVSLIDRNLEKFCACRVFK